MKEVEERGRYAGEKELRMWFVNVLMSLKHVCEIDVRLEKNMKPCVCEKEERLFTLVEEEADTKSQRESHMKQDECLTLVTDCVNMCYCTCMMLYGRVGPITCIHTP